MPFSENSLPGNCVSLAQMNSYKHSLCLDVSYADNGDKRCKPGKYSWSGTLSQDS